MAVLSWLLKARGSALVHLLPTPSHYPLQTKLAMRAEANQIKVLIIGFAVNQDEVGLYMAVAMIGPFTKKRMVNVAAGQGPINGEQIHNLHQGGINDLAIVP